jgi:serine/threonine-protein kinase HipA
MAGRLALLVERFDIRTGPSDARRLALEDFCSILDVPAENKYKGTIQRMARGMRPLSSDAPTDLAVLFARATFAWLIVDGDMHLKNIAMLKVAGARALSRASAWRLSMMR